MDGGVRHRARPGRLTLEITETAVMANPAFTASILEQPHELRLWIAVDDFGTGYSSLLYLRQFPAPTSTRVRGGP